MGVSVDIVVEYDDSHLYYPGEDQPPFATVPNAILFTDYTSLRWGKDTRFLAALGWTSADSRREALFPFRGLPTGLSSEANRYFDSLYDPASFGLGWLRATEVDAALVHQGWARADLSLAVNVVLTAMDYLTEQLGDRRVRLVFGISH